MGMKYRILAMLLCLCTLLSLLPANVFAAKNEQVLTVSSTATSAELEATAAALKKEIAALGDGKDRNGRVKLSGFTQSADGSTDMINLTGMYYIIRKQGDKFYALDGGWTGTEGTLPSYEVVPSETTYFYYITNGMSTSMLFKLSPMGVADNGMPAYKIRFGNGNNLAVGSQISGTTNMYYVKSTAPTKADKVRLEHNDKATYFGIRNLAGTHGLRMNTDNTWRWKDNGAGDNSYEGLGLMLYRHWSTKELRAAIDEVKGFLDAPAFYKRADYEAFLNCLRESIDMFNTYNPVPKGLIEPYDNIQTRIDKQVTALRGYLDSLVFTIEGLPQAETNAVTTLYQLPTKQVKEDGTLDHNMSYIIKTRKGKIIIIDGGWKGDDSDGKYLFSYLQEITGDSTPHVTAWFFTHAHGDHYGAVNTIAQLYADQITVDAFYQHNLTDDQVTKYLYDLDATSTIGAMRYTRIVMRNFKNSSGGAVQEIKVNSIHSGECNSSFDFDEVHIDILQTFTDVATLVDSNNTKYTGTFANQGRKFENMTLKELLAGSINDTSIVFRATVFGKNILFTGDASFPAATALLLNHSRNQSNPEKYFNLKSDYVQVAHHGIGGLPKNVYQAIDPDYALWPSTYEEWNCTESSNPWTYNCKMWLSELGVSSYAAYAGPQKFRFPVIRSEAAVSIPAELKPYVFDAVYYADNNADLKKAYGYDEERLYWHFVNFGIEEGRCASPFFDVKFYMNQNGQNFLYTMKGDYEKAFKHFLSNYKKNTLMKLSPGFDPSVYVTMHTDVSGATQFDLLKHYAANDYLKGYVATASYPTADGTSVHSYCTVSQPKAATCSAEGRTLYVKCDHCKAVMLERQTLPKTDHSYDEGKITTDPTCTEEGVKTLTCTGCKGTKTEAVAALGHTVLTDEAVESTCSKPGLTEGTHCSRCNEIFTAQEEIPAQPHNYESAVTAPNCTEAGFTTYTCTACGDSYSEPLAALGHSYVYTNNGENHTVTCANACGYEVTEAHAYADGLCVCGAVEITEPVLDGNLSFGAQLYLENDLTMAFRVKSSKLANYDLSTAYLVVERKVYETGAKEATLLTTEICDYTISDDGRVVFSYPGISAAQMNDSIKATLYIKDAEGKEYASPVLNTSVATYLDGLLGAYANDAKMLTLIMDMLNYGAAAQVYFDRHADALVNEAFDSFKTYASYASADFTTVLEDLSATTDADGKGGKLNLGLDLGTRIGIQYKVTLPSGIAAEDVSLVITDGNGNTLETLSLTGDDVTVDSRGRYVVNFFGSTSKDMRRVVYATAYAKGEAITGTYAYSISTYAWGVQENASMMDANLVNVTRMMMLYGDAANAYFTK